VKGTETLPLREIKGTNQAVGQEGPDFGVPNCGLRQLGLL
jgi:hypothetical protein